MFSLEKLFNRKPSRQSLAKEVMKRLKQLRPDEHFTYNEAQFQIKGASLVMNLNNLFKDYCDAAPAQRDECMDKFLRGMTVQEMPDTFAEARNNILPALRQLAALDNARISMDSEKLTGTLYEAFALGPFSPELGVGIAYDTADAVQQLSGEQLQKWGVTFEEALDVAIDNLRHKAPPRFDELSPGLFVSNYGDFYDAARILLPEVAWQLPLNGHPIAMAPNRICLLVTGDQDEAGIAAMIETADKVLTENSRPLGAEMFRLVDKTWSPWRPPGALADRLHNIQIQMLSGDYQGQQEALRQKLEAQNEDAFAATFSLAQKEGEPIRSYSVLTKGVATLLPQTDLVSLVDLDTNENIIVSWSAFTEIAGELLEKLPHVPTRYRVKSDPDEEQLTRLREAAAAA